MNEARRAIRLAALRLAAPALVRAGALAGRRSTVPGIDRPLRILLIRPDHVGDVLLATPVAPILRDALPDAQIDWLVGPWSAEIARRSGADATVRTLNFPGFTRHPKRSIAEPYAVILKEARALSLAGYDAALVLRPDHWWGAILATAAGIPRRFGFSFAECQPFLTDTLPPPSGHAAPANQELARLAALRLGGQLAESIDVLAPTFEVSEDERAWVAERLSRSQSSTPAIDGRGSPHPPPAARREHRLRRRPSPLRGRGGVSASGRPGMPSGRSGQGDRRLVAIFPGSGAAIKNWLPARWVEVARALGQRGDVDVVLAGGPGERALVESIANALDPRPETLVGETTLGQLAAALATCDLAIGADSGPLHLAAAVGTPTVRLYGPIDVDEFGPWPPDESQVVLAADLPCQPCRELVAPPCGAVEAPACLRAITVGAVVSAASSLLDRAKGSSPAASAPGRPPVATDVSC